MTIENTDDGESKRKKLKIVFWVIFLAALLWVNYMHFFREISSNPEKINDYVQPEDNTDKFRAPAVAGLFYPSDAALLEQTVGGYLSSAAPVQNSRPEIMIVPHAGYKYSAATAAKAYSRLAAFRDKIRTVVLVGPSHHVGFHGFALSPDDYFVTPLGKVAVNKEITAAFKQQPGFVVSAAAHKKEHSLEVQLPFLQKVLKNFKIVPILYGSDEPQVLAEALSPYVGKPGTLIIFSADLSHYYSYEDAQKLDAYTGDLVAARRPEVESHMSCGATGINTALILARMKRLYPELADMVNSGDVTGDKSGVVGYASWLFDKDKKDSAEQALGILERETKNLKDFAQDYGTQLLKIADAALTSAVQKHKHFKPSRAEYGDILFNRGAAFVTLYKNGDLRGCVGSLMPGQAIAYDVAQNAYRAALEDGRFSPVTPEELKDIKVSISLLTGFEEIEYDDEQDLLSKIIAGTDGIVIKDGNRQGVFLPVVWKQIPQKQEFLNNLKIKAGISPAYWSNKIKVYRFRAVEISKHED